MTGGGTRKSLDKLVDQFVARVNAGPRERLWCDDVPDRLRIGTPDDLGQTDWQIVAAECAWLASMEENLPGPLPPSYRSLVARYVFPAFELGDVLLFANTGEQTRLDLTVALFDDRGLSNALLRDGFVQFGRFQSGYDPVCFDLSCRRGGGECPIVYLDHESALVHDRPEVVSQLADSFLALIAARPVTLS
jgi:hypothetical protein